METSLFPIVDIVHNNGQESYKKIANTSSPTQIKHRSTIVKYTKIPNYESDVKARDSKRSSSTKTSNKSVATGYKEEKLMSTRNTSRFSMPSKYANETKSRTNLNNTQITKEINLVKPVNSRKYSNINNEQHEHGQLKNHKDNGMNRNFKNSNISKTSVSKNIITSKNEQEISLIKTKLLKDVISNVSPTKTIEKSRTDNSSSHTIKNKVTFLKEIQTKKKPVTVIHVPLEEKYHKINSNWEEDDNLHRKNQDCGIYTVKEYKNVNIGTEPCPTTLDQVTEMDDFEFDSVKKYSTNAYIQTEVTKGTFDSLEIPNVTLIKEKSCVKDELDKVGYKSMPDIQMPSVTVSYDKNANDKISLSFCTSYIISRATLTYTTQQKINFHVVESNSNTSNIQTPSPLCYPVNVVSVFKNEINTSKNSKDEEITNKRNETRTDNTKRLNEVESLNCSYGLNSDKLVKPSDIIRTIKINTGFLQNEYMYDEFQRELNFIDSFFESLQYLENSSLSSKCFVNEKVENLVYSPELLQNVFTGKSSDYDPFFTKLNNNGNIDDTETMTSKSLCLLNSLIRDEQRRAKNLLFVLKMREDALKEFATSQILWLENKKKHDNTDVSVLKKKQRGALLKLQHECGEMQRMRKALLTLSEKRKVALMKTKKCLELKLKNNVEVDQIVLGKKKLKKNTSVDRNTSPLKCFDLSSSGCEESSTSKHNSENAVFDNEDSRVVIRRVRCAEKSIQTGDGTMVADKSTETADENFIVVDGGYLNILFHNLSLPQIFSGGKQYEVNEEALKNIVNSSNSHNSDLSKEEIVEKLIDSKSSDGSSSQSTARSLVEEFDQYYKGLDREMSSAEYSDQDFRSPGLVYEMKDSSVQVSHCATEQFENRSYQSVSTMTSDSNDITGDGNNVFSIEQSCMCEALDLANSLAMEGFQLPTQAGPLPVPVGAAAQTDNTTSVIVRPVSKSTATSTISENAEDNGSMCSIVPSISSLTTPAHSEAEELRRQQLAIEREIKALEQEQCQLLVVREIPDKPPPPYTPPVDTRVSKPSPMFLMGESTEEKIRRLIVGPDNVVFDTRDHFNVFLKDFCQESLERHKLENSDEPWDACNLLPQKRQYDTEKLVQRTSLELSEVLNGVTPTFVSGVGARRSDHIDDILFAEWRRCEPEWTSLHTDEASVKNQIFDCIFQKILTETVDEYKKIIKCKKVTE